MAPIAGLVEASLPVAVPSDSTIFILGAISGKLDMILARLDAQDARHSKLEDRIIDVEDQLEKRIELTNTRLRDIEGTQKNQKFIVSAVMAGLWLGLELLTKFGGALWSAIT